MSGAVNIQALVDATLEKGMSVWVEFMDKFEVEIAYVGREEVQKIYAKCTKIDWNPKTHRREDVPDRDKLLGIWSDRAIKNWRGLTLGDLPKYLPIQLGPEDDPKSVVECTKENKIAMLRHNGAFDDFVLSTAMSSEVFMEHLKAKGQVVENL